MGADQGPGRTVQRLHLHYFPADPEDIWFKDDVTVIPLLGVSSTPNVHCSLENSLKSSFYNVVFVCRISSEEFGRKFGSTPKEGEVSNSIDVSRHCFLRRYWNWSLDFPLYELFVYVSYIHFMFYICLLEKIYGHIFTGSLYRTVFTIFYLFLVYTLRIQKCFYTSKHIVIFSKSIWS